MSKAKREIDRLKRERAKVEIALGASGNSLVAHNHWLVKLNALDRQIADAELRA